MKKFLITFVIALCFIMCFSFCFVIFRQDNNSANSNTHQNESLNLAVWNIGHFSGGGSSNSTISTSDYDSKLKAFRNYVYNDINADIIGLTEYSNNFGTSSNGVKTGGGVLFNDYHYQYVGNQYRYSCNALFSKKQFLYQRENVFDCNKNATITHTNAIKASDYYLSADIYVGGELVKLVVCHLAFDDNLNPDTINKNQILELINKFKNNDKVVMMGDWNCRDFDYFNLFISNGYKLANNDSSINTYRLPCDTNCSLDNIIYKGINVSNFKVHTTTLSDHYAISCKVSI